MRILFLFLAFTFSFSISAQEPINQFDANGERHGVWKKNYEGLDQLKFEGEFDHGKEVGTFKFYKPKNGTQPSSIVTYNSDSDLVDVSYFSKKGKLLSKGQMRNRKRLGIWEYYHSNTDAVMMRETYKDDILEGLKVTYFDDGTITDEVTYVSGKREGSYKLYSLKGIQLQDISFENDEPHGPAIYYNGKGEKIIEGGYKRGRKDGYWKYYTNGKLTEEKFFPIK